MKRNPKFEARNPKRIQMTKIENSKRDSRPATAFGSSEFGALNSSRISDFLASWFRIWITAEAA